MKTSDSGRGATVFLRACARLFALLALGPMGAVYVVVATAAIPASNGWGAVFWFLCYGLAGGILWIAFTMFEENAERPVKEATDGSD